MGDRGGTATFDCAWPAHGDYTRWEIGGEPQLIVFVCHVDCHYTRWEIGGEPQHHLLTGASVDDYTRWEIGGEPQLLIQADVVDTHYTRWEIGGEPQL